MPSIGPHWMDAQQGGGVELFLLIPIFQGVGTRASHRGENNHITYQVASKLVGQLWLQGLAKSNRIVTSINEFSLSTPRLLQWKL